MEDLLSTLKDNYYEGNVLQEYDNVTYNFSISIIPESITRNFYSETLVEDLKKPEVANKKIIIAETGATSKYSIGDVHMKTVYSSLSSQNDMCTYEMHMKIEELNGCSLFNKIVSVSRLVGYQSYFQMPLLVELWFSGYHTDTKINDNNMKALLPEGKIPLGDIGNKLSYMMIISDMKTHVKNTGTTYDITLVPTFFQLLSKQNALTICRKDITNVDGQLHTSLEGVSDLLYNSFLTTFAKNNRDKIQSFYSNEPYVTIKLQKETMASIEVSKYQSSYQDKLVQAIDTRIISESQNNASKAEESKTSNTAINERVGYEEVIRNILARTDETRYYNAKFSIKSKYLGKDDKTKTNLYSYTIVVQLNRDSLFDNEVIQKLSQSNNNEIRQLMSELNKNIGQMQLNYILNTYNFRKRYDYAFNGLNTSVIGFDEKFEHLWFLNALASDSDRNISSSISQNQDNKEIIDENITYDNNISIMDTIQQEVTSLDNRLYIDDVYERIDDSLLVHLMNGLYLEERSDPYSDNVSNITDTSDGSKESQYVLSMWQNLYQTGQMLEVRIDILGDPYWLTGGSNELEYMSSSQSYLKGKDPTASNFNFLFTVNNEINRAEGYHNGSDYYRNTSIGPRQSFTGSGIYMVTECQSTFVNGKFTQKLCGVYDQHFMGLLTLNKSIDFNN